MQDNSSSTAAAGGTGAEQAGQAEPAEQATGFLFEPDVAAMIPDWLRPTWDFLVDWPILLLVVLVIVGWLAGKIIQFVLSRSLGRVTRSTKTHLDDALIDAAAKPLMTTTVILALMLGTAAFGLPEFSHNATMRVLMTVLLFVWARAGMRFAHVFLEILSLHRDRFDIVQPRTMPAFDMVSKVLVLGAAAYVFLMVWGINPTAWLASAGVIGLAVGFAAKDTLANFFSGIFIIADAPYQLGDYIVLDTGERGIVKNVGIRSTRLLTRDDIEITIPNAVIGNAKIINESGGPWEKERIRVPVGVSYNSDVDQVCAVLMSIAQGHKEISKEPAPRVRMRAFGASSLDFELLGWIEHPELRGRVAHELNMEIFKRFRAEAIEIPYPQTDLHVRSLPENFPAGDAEG